MEREWRRLRLLKGREVVMMWMRRAEADRVFSPLFLHGQYYDLLNEPLFSLS